MTGSHEVRGSIPLSSTNKSNNLRLFSGRAFSFWSHFVPTLSPLFRVKGHLGRWKNTPPDTRSPATPNGISPGPELDKVSGGDLFNRFAAWSMENLGVPACKVMVFESDIAFRYRWWSGGKPWICPYAATRSLIQSDRRRQMGLSNAYTSYLTLNDP